MIRNSTMKSSNAIITASDNTKRYLSHLQKSYDHLFASEDISRPITAFDRTEFYVDNQLPSISYEVRKDKSIRLITPMIGVSRILSNSMYIDPIFRLHGILHYDQSIELVFVSSLLCCPIRYYHTLNKLIKRHLDVTDSFRFQEHPFYDWLDATVFDYGNDWQGGGHQEYRRYSCMGLTVEDFYQMFGKTSDERRVKKDKLCSTIKVLHDYLMWINCLGWQNKIPTIASLRNKCKEVTSNIKMEFGEFRLADFTSTAIGAGMLYPGKHLRQLSYPIKNMASYNHLCNPLEGVMTEEESKQLCDNMVINIDSNKRSKIIQEIEHGEAMLQYTYNLGLYHYKRDTSEVLLCESTPRRYLNKKDVFLPDGIIFDLDLYGHMMRKMPGRKNIWEKFNTRSQEMLYLTQATTNGPQCNNDDIWKNCYDGHMDFYNNNK